MLSRTIADSKKLSTLSERAALVYLLMLPQHDGEGMVECDDMSMLVACGRFAAAHGWDLPKMAEVREELVHSSIWILEEGPHGIAAEYANWMEHQRLEKIGRGSRITANYGTTSAQLRHNSGLEGKGREVEEKGREGEAPGERAKPTPAPLPHDANHDGDSWSISDEASRIRLALVPIAPAMWTPGGSESELIHRYAREGTCRRWPDGKLAAHLADLHGKIQAKRGKAPDMAYLLRQINADWDPSPEKKATKEIPPARPGDPFGCDVLTGRPYHPGA